MTMKLKVKWVYFFLFTEFEETFVFDCSQCFPLNSFITIQLFLFSNIPSFQLFRVINNDIHCAHLYFLRIDSQKYHWSQGQSGNCLRLLKCVAKLTSRNTEQLCLSNL